MTPVARLSLLLVAFSQFALPVAAQRTATDTLVWPLPPDSPRIRYAGSLSSEQDLGKSRGFFKRFSSALLGDEERHPGVTRPHDVYTDPDGRMFVSNGLSAGVWEFDPKRKEASLVLPQGPAAIGKPMGLDGDGQGHLFVADPITKRVVEIDYEGTFVRAWGGPSLFLNPVDVAVSPDGSLVYVVDSYLHQLLIFERTGDLVRRVGHDNESLTEKLDRLAQPPALLASATVDPHTQSEPSDLTANRGNEPGSFRYPAFVSTAPDGSVYVSDGMNFRVQRFNADGDYLGGFGRLGDTPGSFSRPKGLATDSEGHVYVADAAFNNVQVFDDQGRLLLAFGSFGDGEGEMWMPAGISVDARDRIFVADRYNNRLQIFQYLTDAAAVATPSDHR
ncbi:MAG: 6-bladed beta-propeller [Gemmatimonadota bacterium]